MRPSFSKTGLSLIEALLAILFLSSVILPISMLMGSGTGTENGASGQFTRNSILSHLRDEIDPDRPNFYAAYNQSSNQTVTDNGFTVSYIRKVYLDTTTLTTDDMKRQVDYYILDASGNVLSKRSNLYVLPKISIDVGYSGDANGLGGKMDSTQQNWINDTNAYSNANQVPGYLTGSTGTVGSSGLTLTNVNSADNPIFQTYREATAGPIQYSFDLANGNYLVQLYFAELDSTVTDTSPHRRRADISINGTTVDTNYSPWKSMGAYLLGEIRSYPVAISSGNKLDIIVQDAAGGTDLHARLMGLVVSKADLLSVSATPTHHYRAITIDHTKVPNTDQSNFPILFSGTYSYLATVANGGKVTNANGYDITFTSDAAGTQLLPFEQESYNAATGQVTYWVKVPTLSHTTDTVIYLQYANSAITTDQSNKTGTWDNNYMGIWHFKETPTGTTPQDSTSNNNSMTYSGTWSSGNQVTGQIDGGFNFNGTNDMLSHASSSSVFMPANDSTFSLWVKLTQTASTLGRTVMFIYKNNSSGPPWYSYQFYQDTGNTIDFEWTNNSSTDYDAGSTSTLSAGTWYYLTFTRKSNVGQIYINGTADGSSVSDTGTLYQSNDYLSFGGDAGDYAKGILDEVRISNAARSADWIKTEYNNQNSPSTFYTLGIEQ